MVYTTAIIGCGKIGSEYSEDPRIKGIYSHAEAYTACDKTDLVAVCDTSPDKMKKCQVRWKVRSGYSDYRKMMDQVKPDIVSVCTPDSTHYSILTDILMNSKVQAIFTEKPLAMTQKEAEKTAALAAAKDVVLVVNYPRRYAKNHQKVREDIQKKHSLGIIQNISGHYSKGTLHSGTHWFDLARFFLGEITAVRGFDTRNERNADPTLDAWLKFASGTTGFLHGCDEESYSIFEMDIIGTKGRVRIRDSGNTIEYYNVDEDPDYSGYMALLPAETDHEGLGDVILHAVNDLVSCLENGTQPLCSGQDGIKAIEIASAIQRSVKNNREIPIV
jgi:predicted dehydrogenase